MSRATQVVVEPGFNQSDPPEKACPGGSPKARSTEGRRGVPKLSVGPTASLFPRSRPQAFHTKVWEMEAKETSEKTKPFFEGELCRGGKTGKTGPRDEGSYTSGWTLDFIKMSRGVSSTQ